MTREFYRMVDPNAFWHEVKYLNEYPDTWLGGGKSGWSNLDALWGARVGESTIVYGAPNMGKTTFLLHLALRYVNTNGWKFILWMPEDFSTLHVVRKLLAIILGKSVKAAGSEELKKAMYYLQQNFRFYETAKAGVDWKNWYERMDTWSEEGFTPDAFIFDHALMFEKTELIHEDNVKFMMNSFNDMAEQKNVHNFIVNHITQPKLYYDKSTLEEYLVPQVPSKMAHGQMWERLAQNIIEVFRPKGSIFDAKDGELWVNIHKVKNEDVGSAGRVKFMYDKPNYTINEY